MLNEEAKNDLDSAQATGASETLNEETEQEVTCRSPKCHPGATPLQSATFPS
jgi:hypothetical protein